MKPVVKRPRLVQPPLPGPSPGIPTRHTLQLGARDPSLPQPDLGALQKMGPPMSRRMTEEQRREYEARELSRSRMPSASLDPLEPEKLIGAKEDRPAYRQRQQEETTEQETMSLRKKARVRFSPEVHEKEFDPKGLLTKEEAIAVKQMKPDRGFRRDVPVRKKTRAAPDPTVATELLAQEGKRPRH